MASPYSPAPGGQVLHYPQPHDTTLPPPIQTQDFQPEVPPTPQQQQPLQYPGQQPQRFEPIPQQPYAPQQPFPPPPFDPLQPPLQPLQMPVMPPPFIPMAPPYIPQPPPFYQPPLWTPFHMQSLIPPDTPAHDIIPPTELAAIVPLRTDTHVDRDLALLLTKAHKYGGAVPGGHQSRHKYAKYTFLAGLLLAKRGLPAVAVPDDPDDAYVKLLQVYLSNTSRLGADPDAVLMKTLVKGGRYYEREDRESRRRSRSHSRRSARSGSRRSARSGSGRRSERKSSSRNCSSSSDSSDWES